MEQPSLEDQAMREAHVDKLVSYSALMRIKHLVDERKHDERAQRKIANACFIVAGSLVTLVVVLYIFDATIFDRLGRCTMAVFR